MAKEINARIIIYNMPQQEVSGYVVARLVNAELWYYGIYDIQWRAEEVAEQLGNGVVMFIPEV